MENEVTTLLKCIGIHPAEFNDFLISALSNQLVAVLAEDKAWINTIRKQKDALKCFQKMTVKRTGRKWSIQDIEMLYDRVLDAVDEHHRKPIRYEDLLRLLFNAKHECSKCHKSPPEVILHIDHVFPSSKGGSSKYPNLQFLCEKHNLEKSNKIESTYNLCLSFE